MIFNIIAFPFYLSLNFWWQGSANRVIFKEECMMHMEKNDLVKNVSKCAKHRFATIEIVHGMETHWLSLVKKKFLAQSSVKKVILTFFWVIEGPMTIDLLEKDASVNNTFYCQLCRQYLPYLLNDPYIYIYI